uniref:uroporphyrinogen-III C-methyltransferase n=1 Tax=Magnetococcus massalia (strain MO-1) TaxID=451514 RepID=A0A1S7LJK6_MAGMO|nr:Uroporphyrinogen-III C-methyltransferase [Candidatus Magnetococcus massalia]
MEPGSVVLAGAGPGDPNLLTLGAYKILQACDTLVYDALVSEEILEMVPAGVERHFVGKRGGKPSIGQEAICNLLIDLAKQGKRVVRLKGGDPFVFGRGGEEAYSLLCEQIPFHVIPGITAGVAGPAYAGIPVTHRNINANVAFLTGHESPHNTAGEENTTTVDWAGIGQAFPVLVLYMAVKNLPVITAKLIEGGRSPKTPVAVIRWATTPRQETLITTLEKAVEDIAACNVKPPSIIVIGEVVNFREHLYWFEDKNLIPPQSAQ